MVIICKVPFFIKILAKMIFLYLVDITIFFIFR